MPRATPRAADRARAAVAARLRELGMSRVEVAQRASVSRNTVQRFIDGQLWPQDATLAAIEHALGWQPGHLADVLAEPDAPDVPGHEAIETFEGGQRRVFYIRPEIWERYSDLEQAAIIARATAAAYEAALEIDAAKETRRHVANGAS